MIGKKILVIGCPGSGKSYLSAKLSKATSLPLIHLDMLYWNSDRTTVERSLFLSRLQEVLNGDVMGQSEQTGETAQGIPVATSFWDMDPDQYDLTNPEHQQAIWDIMMQPITVIEGDQTENVYITNRPGISPRPYKDNCAGELHGQSQGVHILEEDTDGDGYVLIEAYSNDGTKSESEYVESLAADRIQGYIKKSRLYTDKPSDKYGILVDKLRQKLYLFEEGRIIASCWCPPALTTRISRTTRPRRANI